MASMKVGDITLGSPIRGLVSRVIKQTASSVLDVPVRTHLMAPDSRLATASRVVHLRR